MQDRVPGLRSNPLIKTILLSSGSRLRERCEGRLPAGQAGRAGIRCFHTGRESRFLGKPRLGMKRVWVCLLLGPWLHACAEKLDGALETVPIVPKIRPQVALLF